MDRAHARHVSLNRAEERQPIDWPRSERPCLSIVIDTEEEFDWDAPYLRGNTHVSAMQHVGRGQRIFDRYGLRPTYVVDYPVVSQPEGYAALAEIHAAGRCEIGAHLHPWVNPPYEEALTPRNSFTLNLPPALQREKLARLGEQIERVFGVRPVVFKAGRYGLGDATVEVLKALGYEVDVSICPRYDFSAQDGPSFAAFDSRPFFLSGTLLEVPCTVDYTGWAGGARPALHRLASRPGLERLYAVGILTKARASNRIMCSPEGNTFEEMRSLVEALVARGERVFTLSFHSPSLDVGHTPYVRTQADLEAFLESIEQFCAFFMERLGGVAVTVRELRQTVLAR